MASQDPVGCQAPGISEEELFALLPLLRRPLRRLTDRQIETLLAQRAQIHSLLVELYFSGLQLLQALAEMQDDDGLSPRVQPATPESNQLTLWREDLDIRPWPSEYAHRFSF